MTITGPSFQLVIDNYVFLVAFIFGILWLGTRRG